MIRSALYIYLTWCYRKKLFIYSREKFLLTVTLDVVDIFQLLNLIVLDGG